MAKKDFKGDFMGFTFNGVHSSDLNIVRTSDGSRYNSDLLPSFNDNTVAVPGGDGTYYFGSYYNQKPFPIQFATDELNEAQFRQLRQWLGDKGIHDLIFDEAPYKKYSAKIAAVPNFNYICFDEGTNHRTYKGEGTIQFVCYYPFARSVHKYLNEYDSAYNYVLTNDTTPISGKTYYLADGSVATLPWRYSTGGSGGGNMSVNSSDNPIVRPEVTTVYYFKDGIQYYERGDFIRPEWADASGLLEEEIDYDEPGDEIYLYNPGDLDTDIKIITEATSGLTFELVNESANFSVREWQLILNDITFIGNDVKIRIDSSTHLIEGLDSNNIPTGNLYNKYISSGDFFKVPLGESTLTGPEMEVEYDYLYY